MTNVVSLALKSVGLIGPANVQGFVTEDGGVAVHEINPRFSGGLPLTLAAGCDVVEEYLRDLMGLAVRPERLVARPGVTMSRYFCRGLRRVSSRPHDHRRRRHPARGDQAGPRRRGAARGRALTSAASPPASTATRCSTRDLFAELGCAPDAAWLLEGNEGERVGQLLTHAYADLEAHRPDVVLVLGDTYTAPLVAMAARRAGVGVVHLEAGPAVVQRAVDGGEQPPDGRRARHAAPGADRAGRRLPAPRGRPGRADPRRGQPGARRHRRDRRPATRARRAVGRAAHRPPGYQRRRSGPARRAGRRRAWSGCPARRRALPGAPPHPRPAACRRAVGRAVRAARRPARRPAAAMPRCSARWRPARWP